MRAADRAVILGLLIAGLIALYWFAVLSPKREEASKLDDEVASLTASIDEQEQLVAAGQRAQEEFPTDYHRLVVLGKAVPSDDDAASLFVELQEIADRSGVDFGSIEISESGGTSGQAAPPPAPDAGADESASAQDGSDIAEPAVAAPATPAPALATEASAAALPIGAAVGPAGLPTLPYEISLTGDFFELADFLADVDRLVGSRLDRPAVDGRLITTDGFSMQEDQEKTFPNLAIKLAVTTYVTPAGQGSTAGASPASPAPAGSTGTTPTAASTP